jgi:hypothetical protein
MGFFVGERSHQRDFVTRARGVFARHNRSFPVNITSQKKPDHPDIRCTCGQLIARWTRAGVEIKCKRCRRLIVIPYPSIIGQAPSPLP